ncbi:MAG TPA: tetratricopeptide repeat protein [Pyrinomonadaceae bacterium]|nr:tetratricopeptide repeat protein [Pyrinomonadaceae bacterium]
MSFRNFATAVLFFVLPACCGHAALAQGHAIRGKVRNTAGANVPRAAISLEQNGAMVDQTVTNNEGDFSFTGLMDTSYVVIVSAADYNTTSESVQFVMMPSSNSMGETRTVEITLAARGGVRPPRAGLNFVQDVPRPAREAFDAGMKLARENRAQEAVASYERAVQLFPDYFDARLVLASESARAGRHDDAIKHLDEARRVNPKDDRVYDLFARIMMEQRKYAVAARIFAEAARLNPADPQYPLSQGAALIEQAAAIDPARSQAAKDERAFALDEAEKALTRASVLSNKKSAEVHRQLARLYEKKGDRPRAADELEQYLRKTPGAKNADAIREAIRKLREPARQN